MDFVLLLLINLAILALMYLVLRHQLMKNYSNERFLETLQKEVNGIMTDLNQATETNVQIIAAEAEKLKSLQGRVENRIAEMQQIFAMLDRADGRYNEIIEQSRRLNRSANAPGSSPPSAAPPREPVPSTPSPGAVPGTTLASGTQAEAAALMNDAPSPREMVLGLYNQGRDPVEIAERTRLSVGEVELIIELSK
jgi:uncharacterized protein YoxC